MAKHHKTPPEFQTDAQLSNLKPTLSRLREDSNLWYRIHILLYDFNNVAQDPQSEKRLSLTLHPLYISSPYFSDAESTRILQTIIHDPTATSAPTTSDDDDDRIMTLTRKEATIEQAIYDKMTNFLTKRKASGDARPCGPHDLVPIYGAIFSIAKDELEDERFLARLRRSGLGDGSKKEETAINGSAKKCTKGQKKG